ncbi:hypothetical protein [Chitinibacter sp. GC72]|uniref:hypothetical protein n=1 Tax=Chitinibacter sp. GC72 TaxID=1526917 RepID=UPI0012FA642D|nr:hypothetical protein [Chitinibacter sp. GC72]
MRVIQNGIEDAAIVVLSATVKLINFNITVPGGVSAVKAKANAIVYLNESRRIRKATGMPRAPSLSPLTAAAYSSPI